MTVHADVGAAIAAQVERAHAERSPLAVVGGGTKTFLGRTVQAQPLAVSGHRGVVEYEPTELVITARAGTPLAEVESVLAAEGQMLAFEPPHLGEGATLGGTVAAGLSGPRRPFAGAVRDFVLGTRIVNGRGESLSFGGRVMKNVAGYDLSRLMCGALGTLGVVLEVSLKVLPRPAQTEVRTFELDAAAAIARLSGWGGRSLPIAGGAHDGERLWLRLEGTPRGVSAALCELGGDAPARDDFFQALREQRLAFFDGAAPLWRVSVPPATAPLDFDGPTLLDWGGGLRWVRSERPPEWVRERVAAAGGHAVVFRHGDRRGEVHHPLAPGVRALHERLKRALDPHRVLNPDRLYAGL